MQDKEILNNHLPSFHHLHVLGSMVYIFFHKENRILKLSRLDARALKKRFVRFDGYIIYRVHIEDQNKVIRVKDLQMFENTSTKAFSALPDFDEKPTFNAIQIPDEQDLSNKNSVSKNEKGRPKPPQKPRTTRASRDILTRASQEKNEPKVSEKLTKSQVGRRRKPTPKRQNEIKSTKTLIMELILLLKNVWEED